MWYKNNFKRSLIDMHIPDWNPEFLSKFDPEKYADSVYASGAEVALISEYTEEGAVQIITDSAAIYIPMADMVDFEAERARLTADLKKLEGEIKRCEGKLSNESFVAKAPEAVVAAEKEKLEKYKAQKAGVEEALAAIAGK